MIDAIINLALLIIAVAAAFAWGYEKGRGDAMEDEIKYIESRLSQKKQKHENESEPEDSRD